MLGMEVPSRLAAHYLLCQTLLLSFAVICSASDVRLGSTGVIFAPMDVNHTVQLQCEVPHDTTVQWNINTHPIDPEEHPNIFINTTTNGSVLHVGDEGLDTFGTVQGSAVLHIACTAVDFYNRFRTVGSQRRKIVRFEAPDSPGNITVSLRSGHISWKIPENMVPEVHLNYDIVIQDLATGVEFKENVTRERLRLRHSIPECYNITVWAKNTAGTSEPSSLSHFQPSCSGGGTTESPNMTGEVQDTTTENPAATTDDISGSLSSSGSPALLLSLGVPALLIRVLTLH